MSQRIASIMLCKAEMMKKKQMAGEPLNAMMTCTLAWEKDSETATDKEDVKVKVKGELQVFQLIQWRGAHGHAKSE